MRWEVESARAFPAPSWGLATRKPGGTERVATHDDWQSANCPLQLCMQVVVVEVSGVESPVKGVVTFGVVEVCANAASRTPKRIAAAAISIATLGLFGWHHGLASCTMPHGRLMLTVLGGLAEFERELIKARTEEGRKRSSGPRVNHIRFGRELKLTPHQQKEALARREAGETLAEIGRSYNVSHSTISGL